MLNDFIALFIEKLILLEYYKKNMIVDLRLQNQVFKMRNLYSIRNWVKEYDWETYLLAIDAYLPKIKYLVKELSDHVSPEENIEVDMSYGVDVNSLYKQIADLTASLVIANTQPVTGGAQAGVLDVYPTRAAVNAYRVNMAIGKYQTVICANDESDPDTPGRENTLLITKTSVKIQAYV